MSESLLLFVDGVWGCREWRGPTPHTGGTEAVLHNMLSLAAALTQSVFALFPLLVVPTEPFVEPGWELTQL